ncbi:MAG: TraR/DksA family transcriptional regulator [Frankiaceae bacterium]
MVDVQATRDRLTEMLADLDRSAEVLDRDDADLEPGELSNLDQHPADTATYLQDSDREQSMREVVDGRRQEVEAALRRLDGGSYGRCVDCGNELSPERLDARPEAARCVDCQAKAEAAAR